MTAKHELKGKTYDLCGVHGMLIEMYEHVLTCSGEQKDNKLGSEPDEGKLNPKVDNSPSNAHTKGLRGEFLVEPLSGTEINKGPAVKKLIRNLGPVMCRLRTATSITAGVELGGELG